MSEDKVLWLVEEGRVKVIRFLPSRNELYLVVGREDEYVVNLKPPYCSCNDFFFRMMKKGEQCVHIKALDLALKERKYVLYLLSDVEAPQMFKYLIRDELERRPR